MKRIRYACIEKTIHFQLKDGLEHELAVSAVKDEVEAYKNSLDRKHTQFRVLSESTEPDGSIVLVLKMQYNNHPVGHYLDA